MVAACADLKVPTLLKFALVPPSPFYVDPAILAVVKIGRTSRQHWFATSRLGAAVVEHSFDIEPGEIDHFHVAAVGLNSLLDINRSNYYFNNSIDDIRNEFGIDGDAFLITTVGRLSKQKGYDVYIEILNSILETIPKAHFLWIGDGELRPQLKARAKELGISHKLTMTGFRMDVRPWLRTSDLFVFPTIYEGGTSQAVLEAMEEGLPIVTSRIIGIEEVLREGIEGLLAEPDNPTDLKNMIIESFNNNDARHSMALAAKERVKRYSVSALIAETISRIDYLLGTSLRYSKVFETIWNDPKLAFSLGGPASIGCGTYKSFFDMASILDYHFGYRHSQIEIEINNLVYGSNVWPFIRFKFQIIDGEISLEFRQHQPWPKMFQQWPSELSDQWGTLATFSSSNIESFLIEQDRPADDQRLLVALVQLMPRIIESALSRSNIEMGHRGRWVFAAEEFSSAYLERISMSLDHSRTS
ncbi:glycosyltransferase [Sphingobium sp.]|uniref:glycosyltransferase n=1 Tax=Sphingobium sp. TaxID=1912891 RepID=UPI003BB63049